MSAAISTINPFDDKAGAFQGSTPGYLPFGLDAPGGALAGDGGAKAPKRGTPRSGGAAPDQANFQFNWDPSQTALLGAQAQDLGEMTGQHGRSQAGYSRQDANFAAGRTTPQMNTAPAMGAADQAMARGGTQGDMASQIAARAGQATGSGAQAQFQQGMNEAMNAQLAIAGQGSGLGGNAASVAQASYQAPQLIAQQANDAARLQAETDQADAARQLQALGMSGQLTGEARGQDIGLAGMLGDLSRQQADIGLQGMSLNDQMRLGLGQEGLSYDQMGLQGQLDAGRLGLSAQELMQGGEATDLEGRIAYEQALNDLYGIDVTGQAKSRELDIQKGQNAMGSVGGLMSAIGGMALMSDERSKKNERLKSLSSRYSAIGGY